MKERKNREGTEALDRLCCVTLAETGREMQLCIVNITICRAVADGFRKPFYPVCHHRKTWFSVCVNTHLSSAQEQAKSSSDYYSLLQQEVRWFYGFLDHGLWQSYFQKLEKNMCVLVSDTKPKLSWFNRTIWHFAIWTSSFTYFICMFFCRISVSTWTQGDTCREK